MISPKPEQEILEGLIHQARILSTSARAPIDVRRAALTYEQHFATRLKLVRNRNGRSPAYKVNGIDRVPAYAEAEVIGGFRNFLRIVARMGGDLKQHADVIERELSRREETSLSV